MLISIFITEETAWFRSLKHDCTALFVNLLYFSLSLSFVCFSLLFFQFVILYTVDTFSVRSWYGAMFSSVFSSLYICFYSNKYFDCCWTFQIVSRVEKWQSLMKKIAQMFKMFLIQVWFPSEDWLLYKKKKKRRPNIRPSRSQSFSDNVRARSCIRVRALLFSTHTKCACTVTLLLCHCCGGDRKIFHFYKQCDASDNYAPSRSLVSTSHIGLAVSHLPLLSSVESHMVESEMFPPIKMCQKQFLSITQAEWKSYLPRRLRLLTVCGFSFLVLIWHIYSVISMM